MYFCFFVDSSLWGILEGSIHSRFCVIVEEERFLALLWPSVEFWLLARLGLSDRKPELTEGDSFASSFSLSLPGEAQTLASRIARPTT